MLPPLIPALSSIFGAAALGISATARGTSNSSAALREIAAAGQNAREPLSFLDQMQAHNAAQTEPEPLFDDEGRVYDRLTGRWIYPLPPGGLKEALSREVQPIETPLADVEPADPRRARSIFDPDYSAFEPNHAAFKCDW